tara:strand:- start:63 stop:1133 length:1071 start_codon:yes stop_codon:yes gene_type:complete
MDINVIAPANSLGYGVVGTNVTKYLSKIANVALWTIGNAEVSEKDVSVLRECASNANFPNFSAPCVRIWHQHDMSQFVGRGMRVGFPIFELDQFTPQETHHLKSLDKIFVCSSWAKKIVVDAVEKSHYRVSVIPLGVDRSIFPETDSNRTETVFLNVGKWEIRKGHDVLVEAFNQAFNEDDNVELWMMCHNPFYDVEGNREWQNLYKNSKLGSKIRIIPRQQTQKEVYSIMAQSDCGVFPSRAEGWNLEALEMMSCGKQVIATNYSAHTEFCNGSNSLLVDIDSTEDAFDGKWFKGQGKWAKIDDEQISDISNHLRNVHEQKSSGKDLINTEGIKTAEKFSWENTAREIVSSLSLG